MRMFKGFQHDRNLNNTMCLSTLVVALFCGKPSSNIVDDSSDFKVSKFDLQ